MANIIHGNLLDLAEAGMFDVIIHGCNCFNTMGSGIAKQLADRWPEVKKADHFTAHGDPHKLGTISEAYIPRRRMTDSVWWTDEDGNDHEQRQDPVVPGMFTVVNAYCQFHYGWGYNYFQADKLESCLYEVLKKYPEAKIGYPLIGCGHAGGTWMEVGPIIETVLGPTDHTLVLLPGADVKDSFQNRYLSPKF